jgi:hypothetical protein
MHINKSLVDTCMSKSSLACSVLDLTKVNIELNIACKTFGAYRSKTRLHVHAQNKESLRKYFLR